LGDTHVRRKVVSDPGQNGFCGSGSGHGSFARHHCSPVHKVGNFKRLAINVKCGLQRLVTTVVKEIERLWHNAPRL